MEIIKRFNACLPLVCFAFMTIAAEPQEPIAITTNTVWTDAVTPGMVFVVAKGVQFSFDPEPKYGMDSRMNDDGGITVTILEAGDAQAE